MKVRVMWLLGAVAFVVAVGAVWREKGPAAPPQAPAAESPRAPQQAASAVAQPVQTPVMAGAASGIVPPASASTPLPAQPSAAQTMAEARLHGDDRAPPIEPPTPDEAAPQPTPWDLSDPTRYQAYEQREKRRVEAAYLKAAEQELPRWKEALAEARARGLSNEELAAGVEKIRRLEAMRAQLRQGAAASAP